MDAAECSPPASRGEEPRINEEYSISGDGAITRPISVLREGNTQHLAQKLLLIPGSTLVPRPPPSEGISRDSQIELPPSEGVANQADPLCQTKPVPSATEEEEEEEV